MTAPQVYVAIANITAALSKEGIAKGRKNQQQGFQFRGIDDVYNALAPLLAQEKLCIIPRVRERTVTERETKAGGALFGITVLVEFDLVSAVDGSHHTATLYGEAMDSGDKGTNKALSAAYKYMAMEVFCIPTEGDDDSDTHSHEVKAKRLEHVDEHGEIHEAPTQVNGVVFATASDTALAKLADWCEKEPQTRAKYLKAIHAEQKRRIASGMATGSNPGLVEPPAERLKAADHAAAGK